MCPVEMSMLDWTGSSHHDGVLLCELGLGCGASLNCDETLLTRDVSAGAAGASARPKSDLVAMCWRHSSWGRRAEPRSSATAPPLYSQRCRRSIPHPYLVLEGGVGGPLGPQGGQALLLPLLGVLPEAEGCGGCNGGTGHAGQSDEGEQHRVEAVPKVRGAWVHGRLVPLQAEPSKG